MKELGIGAVGFRIYFLTVLMSGIVRPAYRMRNKLFLRMPEKRRISLLCEAVQCI